MVDAYSFFTFVGRKPSVIGANCGGVRLSWEDILNSLKRIQARNEHSRILFDLNTFQTAKMFLRCAILAVVLIIAISARPDQSAMDDEAHRDLARNFQTMVEGTRRVANLVREVSSQRSLQQVAVTGELLRQFVE